MEDLRQPAGKRGTGRPRTSTRARNVLPPAFMVSKPTSAQTIGRYEIIEVLGKGAMGVVYKARDPLLDRTVAVKTIVAASGVGRRVRRAYFERFEREAKAAAKMQHPGIVTIFDVGLDDEQPFMVLEYLPGDSLADRLDRVRMPLGRAVEIARDLASALGFAHKQRIVHRDVKPANVLNAGENRWKLADFGIARLPDSDLTQAGIFMGTPGYAPPEAIREGRYTVQADVFAWGAVLYELLSGRISYEGPDTPTTNGYVLKGAAPSPRHYDPSIPEPLADVVMRALAGDPAERFKDASEAEGALMEAWTRCLKHNLVHPMALTAEEVAHESAGSMMHGPVTGEHALPPERPGAADTRVDSAGATAEFRGHDVAAPDADANGKVARPIVVEASDHVHSAGDDEPTRLMIRASTGRGSESSGSIDVSFDETQTELALIEAQARKAAAGGEGDIQAQARKAAKERSSSEVGASSEPELLALAQPPPKLWVWLTLGFVAVIGGAIVAFYIWRL